MPFGDPSSVLVKSYSPVGAIISESVLNNKIFAGQVFGAARRFDLVSGGVTDFIFDTTPVMKDFAVFLPFVFGAYGAGPVHIDIYTGTEYTGGTPVPIQNRSLRSSILPEMTITTGATISDVGTLFPWEYSILSNGQAASAAAGSQGGPSLPLDVVAGETVVLVRLTNTDNNDTAICNFAFNWLEFDQIP